MRFTITRSWSGVKLTAILNYLLEELAV
jgi:hypothetical protein